MSLQTVCPKVKFRPPFQRRWNPKVKPLVAPRTERNSFPCKSAGGETKQSGGLFRRGEPSPGVPRIAQIARFYLDSFSPVTTFIVGLRHAPACTESRCALAHNKSRLLLRNKNNLVLPTSASTVFCRGGSPCPPAPDNFPLFRTESARSFIRADSKKPLRIRYS